MEETIVKYGTEGFMQLFAITTPAHLIMTIITSWIFLKDETVQIKRDIITHLLCALFYALIFVVYNKFMVDSGNDILITTKGIVSTITTLLITTVFALVFNMIFRIKILSKRLKK